MVPEEAASFIGRLDPPIVRDVEKGSIRRYAEAVGNENSLYYDVEYARKTKYEGIIAPPGFFGRAIKPPSAATGLPDIVVELQDALRQAGYPRVLDGGISYEFFIPVRAGDILVATPKIKNITEKQGKSGIMMLCQFDVTYVNQNGDVVANVTQSFFMLP